MTITSLLLLAGAAVAQPPEPAPVLPYPPDPNVSAMAPVVDAQGAPLRREIHAAGNADLDLDGNADLWFLADDQQGGRSLHVLLANTGDLGRFRRWHDYPGGTRTDAATYRSTAAADQILLTDPAASRLTIATYLANWTGNDPRFGGTWVMSPVGWALGGGCFEIDTADHDGNGHDDLVLLRDLGSGGTEIKTVFLDNPLGGPPMPQHERTLSLPVPLRRARSLDADGDGRSDVVVEAPGIGVVVFQEAGGGLQPTGFLPAAAGIVEIFTGDLDGDGRDDVGVVLDAGIIVLRSTGAGFVTEALAAPAGARPLAGGLFLDIDADGDTDAVGFARSGDRYVAFLRQPALGWLPPQIETNPAPGAGAGVLGLACRALDVDADGDADLLAQLDDGRWVTLRQRLSSIAPASHSVTHEGRYGESYISERIDVRLPESWLSAGIDAIEVGIYMRDPRSPTRDFVLWDHWVEAADHDYVRLRLYYLVDRSRLQFLVAPNQFPGGTACHGDTMITIHGRRGKQRLESRLIYHEGRGDENKSTLGVQWRVLAAPPLPETDAELLPFD